MPNIPPLRQLSLARSGRPFIPGLKSPGVSGRFLKNIERNNQSLLEEIVGKLYRPRTLAAARVLTNLFVEAENAFFEAMEPLYPVDSPPLGEIHLTTLFGTEPGPATYLAPSPKTKGHEWYLTKTMTAKARRNYENRLKYLSCELDRASSNINDSKRVQRIQACLTAFTD